MSVFIQKNTTTTTKKTGVFFCPTCQTKRPYNHQVVTQSSNVFSISIKSAKKIGEYIECQTCKSTFRMSVLSYQPKEKTEFLAEYHIAIRKVLLLMVLADGEIKSDEIKSVASIFQQVTKRPLSEYEIDVELTEMQSEPQTLTQYLQEVAPYMNYSSKEMIIRAAFLIADSDGSVDFSELNFLRNLGETLELTPKEIKRIIKLVM